MQKTILLLKQEFESSSGITPEFQQFYLTFIREFRKLLRDEFNVKEIKMSKGHFEISGFFKLPNGNIYYFSLGDVRWDKGYMLVRTAESFKDYTGGSNMEVPMDNRARFVRELKRIVK